MQKNSNVQRKDVQEFATKMAKIGEAEYNVE